jgi:hypothetical protein
LGNQSVEVGDKVRGIIPPKGTTAQIHGWGKEWWGKTGTVTQVRGTCSRAREGHQRTSSAEKMCKVALVGLGEGSRQNCIIYLRK